MRRPSKSADEIAVANGAIWRGIHKLGPRQAYFRRTGGIARDLAPADHIGGGEDLCRVADRQIPTVCQTVTTPATAHTPHHNNAML